MAYVVKSWQASPQPNERGEYVKISGRQEGVISWLLSYVGIDPTVHMTVTAENFHLEARTFWGYSKRTVPIAKISEVCHGFMRPWLTPFIFWLIGGFCFFGAFGAIVDENGGMLPALGMLFLACVLFGSGYLIYFLRRHLIVEVVGAGGNLRPLHVAFQPSFIEGKAIDADAAEVVGRIIQALVDKKSEEIGQVIRALRRMS